MSDYSVKGNRFHPDTFAFGGILQGQRIGYVRVSSFDQNPERQLEGVQVARVFTDKATLQDASKGKSVRMKSITFDGICQSIGNLTLF